MIQKKYPLILFGMIAAYHVGVHFIGSDYGKNLEEQKAQAEAERRERLKAI